MKIPVWVWDKRQKKYLRLPPGLTQFSDGNWGVPVDPWTVVLRDELHELDDFLQEYTYLFRFEAIKTDANPGLGWGRWVLRSRGQDKHRPNKGKARTTKVQR